MKHHGAVDDPKDITTKEYVDAADNALKVKVDALWDFVCTDITSNPLPDHIRRSGGADREIRHLEHRAAEARVLMGNCYNYTPIPPAEASCIIAHLFVELALPCSCCKREDGVIVIQGKTYDGSSARVTIKGEEVRYYGKQRTLAAIRAGQCRPPALRP